MRELRHDGVVWRVREADATRIPGARGGRCLIFDSDGIVRRAWSYPASWRELDDTGVWELLDREVPSPISVEPMRRTSSETADRPAVVAATTTAARTRSPSAEVEAVRDPSRTLNVERAVMLEQHRQDREKLRRVIHAYTETLRRGNFSPEQAVILVKSAIQEGLGGPAASDEPGGEAFVSDGVAWCLEAYFAV